jgi:SAM-dependent methyltransferase
MNPAEPRCDPAHAALEPSAWILRHASLIPDGARVLDLACGNGRHARWFAQRGAHVVAVDRDTQLLRSLDGVPGIVTHSADLERDLWPFQDERFDAIVVVNYLHRPLFATLLSSLAPDGAMLYETFAVGNERFGKPSNPDFLLAPDELLDFARETLQVVAFEQGAIRGPTRSAVVQRLAAVGRARPWPAPLAATQ